MKAYSLEKEGKEEETRYIFILWNPLLYSNLLESGTWVLTQLLGQFK